MTPSSVQIDVLRSPEAWEELRAPWNDILASHSSGIDDLDVTSGFDWMLALWETHLNSGAIELLVLREGSKIQGILPFYRFDRKVRRVPCRNLAPVCEVYSGRTGFLLRNLDHDLLDAVFAHLAKLGSWDTFTTTLVRGSVHDRLFRELASARGFHVRTIEEHVSPYIRMQESWGQHFASLPKKLRSTIRNGEKRLRERGTLAYRECRSLQEAHDFSAAVALIERDSWKDAAGTSIAANPLHEAFHHAMVIRAAESGFFSGHLLLLDDCPIAYVMGLLYNGVFLDLKESYKNSLRESSPGHVLKNFVFNRLYEHNAKIYDFMGKCEDYKMKWTDNTYCRATYLLFNNTLRGRTARFLSNFLGRSSNASETSERQVNSTLEAKPTGQAKKGIRAGVSLPV